MGFLVLYIELRRPCQVTVLRVQVCVLDQGIVVPASDERLIVFGIVVEKLFSPILCDPPDVVRGKRAMVGTAHNVGRAVFDPIVGLVTQRHGEIARTAVLCGVAVDGIEPGAKDPGGTKRRQEKIRSNVSW
jgi:hypothetical protein